MVAAVAGMGTMGLLIGGWQFERGGVVDVTGPNPAAVGDATKEGGATGPGRGDEIASTTSTTLPARDFRGFADAIEGPPLTEPSAGATETKSPTGGNIVAPDESTGVSTDANGVSGEAVEAHGGRQSSTTTATPDTGSEISWTAAPEEMQVAEALASMLNPHIEGAVSPRTISGDRIEMSYLSTEGIRHVVAQSSSGYRGGEGPLAPHFVSPLDSVTSVDVFLGHEPSEAMVRVQGRSQGRKPLSVRVLVFDVDGRFQAKTSIDADSRYGYTVSMAQPMPVASGAYWLMVVSVYADGSERVAGLTIRSYTVNPAKLEG